MNQIPQKAANVFGTSLILYSHLQFQEVFQSYEKNGSGYMDAANLRQALSCAGYHLNFRILNILVHRYGNKKGEIAFSDFIMCAIRLKAMIGKNCVHVVTAP
jgi:Ca2+-binding EF-hand superfamily protein